MRIEWLYRFLVINVCVFFILINEFLQFLHVRNTFGCCYRRESNKYIKCLLKFVGFEVAVAGLIRLLTIVLLFVNLLVFR